MELEIEQLRSRLNGLADPESLVSISTKVSEYCSRHLILISRMIQLRYKHDSTKAWISWRYLEDV